MKIGIYGGTFNPIHRGHMAAARQAAEALKLDKLLLIPTRVPPHKALTEDVAGPEHRLEMTRFAVQALNLDGVAEASDLELRREGKSYTLDTLREIRALYPKGELFLLLGTDMFLTFHQWRHPEEIAKLCTLCAFHRSALDSAGDFASQKRRLERKFGAHVKFVDLQEVVDISSTRLRQMLPAGQGREFLAPAVYGCILREGLYGTNADLRRLSLEDLRCVALSMLDPRRIPHVLGTEETAAALALRWGADEESARRAALLHDCTKKFDKELQMALCRQYGIEPDAAERREGKLLHAITGAAVAYADFGVSGEVRDAIRWHTTGKADMTLLEKIIYLADYIEPTRDFCDLTELRRLAFEDLDGALLLGFTMAVEDLAKKGMPVHPNSVLARDYLKGNRP